MATYDDLAGLPDPYPIHPITGRLDADVTVPGSKSLTNRALVCAALADGSSVLEGALFADDTEAMLGVLDALGVNVDVDRHENRITVHGSAGTLAGYDGAIDVRQSGTTSRFTLPLLLAGRGTYQVTAHPQMQARPMATTIDALRSLGAQVAELGNTGHLPVRVTPGPPTLDGTPVLDVAGNASSQFLSGLLMAGPCLPAGLTLRLTTDLVSRPYIDLTTSVMRAFGATVDQPDDRTFHVAAGGYAARRYEVEPDASAASYPLAAAALCGGRVRVAGLTDASLQGDAEFVDILAAMGATVIRDDHGTEVRAEPRALRGGTFDFTHLSDTAQTLAAIAPFASETVTITGIGFIRHKEIDRVEAVATELGRLGVAVAVDTDGWTIEPGLPRAGAVQTYEDHRMAMSFALCGLQVPGIQIAGPACVAKTFPGYWNLLAHLQASST
ncbi:MAG: 3-phosphoshikimate 1-carboxyvinyltransferase [Aquihabitans sp.]